MKHLLSVADLGAPGLTELLDLTDRFVEVSRREIRLKDRTTLARLVT